MKARVSTVLAASLLCVAATAWAQTPGLPLVSGVPAFTIILREPPEVPGTPDNNLLVPLPAPVQSGYVILLENTSNPIDQRTWSDVVVFHDPGTPPASPGLPANFVSLISDPSEQGITDADLAPVGITVRDIQAGIGKTLTLIQAEGTRTDGLNEYCADGRACQYLYQIYSDAPETTCPKPGTPLNGVCPVPPITLTFSEPTADQGSEQIQKVGLPFQVQSGYVLLVEDVSKDVTDPHNWSDVLVFGDGRAASCSVQASTAFFVSDAPNAAGVEDGFTDADLAPVGVKVSDIQAGIANGLTLVFQESFDASGPNTYCPVTDATGNCACVIYVMQSDPPETPVKVQTTTLGHVKAIYR
jgi:hypothetical protein